MRALKCGLNEYVNFKRRESEGSPEWPRRM